MKPFMIRLYQNNLYLGYKTGNKTTPPVCYTCCNHRESRVELLLNCNITSKILQLMIRVLRKAGCLSIGCKIDMFLFDRYPVSSIENITLMFTWKFIYNSKFNDCPLKERTFLGAYRGLIAIIIHMSLPISLMTKNITNILIADFN